MTNITVGINKKKEITVLLTRGGSGGGGGTVIINNDNFLGFLDASTNIATKGATVINPAIVSGVAPTPAEGYYFVEVAGNLNIDNIANAEAGQTVFFRAGLRNVETNSTAIVEAHIANKNNPHETSFANIVGNARDNTDLDSELTAIDNEVALKEDIANKATDFTIVNDTLYPSVEAVKEVTDTKLNIQTGTSTATTMPFLVDTIYGTYATPLTGNITLTTVGAIEGVTNDLFHNDATEPTFTNATSVNGTYTTGSVNAISLQYKGGAFIVYIQTLA